jgi:predicted nuclease of restriction endonuclease-like (RecB) superfamily
MCRFIPALSVTGFPSADIVRLIDASREEAMLAVNTALIELYWRVGEVLSRRIAAGEWGEGVVPHLAAHIARTHPGVRGFTRPNLFRMRRFYETYADTSIVSALPRQFAEEREMSSARTDVIVSAVPRQSEMADASAAIVPALLTQLPWTHHPIILGQSKRPGEREFYLRMAIRERWSSRELERQLKAALFERIVLTPPKFSPLVRQIAPDAPTLSKDAYMLEFLGLPTSHAETDLHRGLLVKLKEFLLELGRDFCFVGSEYPLHVGGRDFALDLLFFHRGLNCVVAIELKVGRFEPEYLGKLNFYLEALDRDVRKAHEHPSIGVLLCPSKDDEVVEYALSRRLSPALIAEYQTQLPDKKLLQAKLHEFYLQNAPEGDLA